MGGNISQETYECLAGLFHQKTSYIYVVLVFSFILNSVDIVIFCQGLFPIENKKSDGYTGLSPVDAYPEQNDFGMYDMVGNVWEWTSTIFSLKYRYHEIVNDIKSKPKKDHEYVVRGGSFVDSSDGGINFEARCATR